MFFRIPARSFKFRAIRRTLVVGILMVVAPAQADQIQSLDIHDTFDEAEFVFNGTVTDIRYQNSALVPKLDDAGAPVVDPNGNPVYDEWSEIPHTFVTYQINHIYKGLAPGGAPGGSELTLRFLGGQSSIDPSRYTLVSNIPLFDLNDRDILFVAGNADRSCPLADHLAGRFRILRDPNDPADPSTEKIYNEFGWEVALFPGEGTEPAFVSLGPAHALAEVDTHDMGLFTLGRVTVAGENEFDFADADDDPVPDTIVGAHFTLDGFHSYLTQIASAACGTIPPPAECLVEVVNADPAISFEAVAFRDTAETITAPVETVQPRPWLDALPPEEKAAILEAERVEAELYQGNPVLPKTPCELFNATDGPIRGDISGPAGTPDCRVDLYDAAALFSGWLVCVEWVDESCPN
jgi:hypothetical protein